ncbi:MAG: VWA domain-containing protein, partial [Alphaproteobacteria bacterium]|nr:VWA domain-containing protein [Alphaproteobacteria bacterium]
MTSPADSPAPDDGNRLAENIMHFARVLRAAGLPLGPGKVLDGVRAVIAAGGGSRAGFSWALFAGFCNPPGQRAIFAP